MSDKSGIKVENRRSLLQKELKVDFKSLLLTLGKSAVNIGFLQFDDLAENGVELLESLGLETKAEEIAGLLIVRSLKQAIINLNEEYIESFRPEQIENIPASLKDFSITLSDAIGEGELTIDSDFFAHPEQLALVSDIKLAYGDWLQDFVNRPVDAEKVSSSFPAYFVEALNEEWLSRSDEYAVLRETLDTPFTQANKRQQQWLRYRAWLQKQIEEPMFAEAFSLNEIYVPLRAYYERKNQEKENESVDGTLDLHREYQRVAVRLDQALQSWLDKNNRDDAIRLITGSPGSGKSSSCKIFAAEQARKRDINTLFIPLHKFSHGEDLVKAINEFAQTDCFLSGNLIARDNEDLRLLIIFDGLDELSMQGKIAENAAKDFVEAVKFLVSQFNTHKTRLQVIISGREVVVQANRNQRQLHQLLYLLPYVLSDSEYNIKKYVDEANILKSDQRQTWWQNYGRAKGKEYDGLPPALDQDNLVEITTQPLLNYLIALSYEREKIEFTADTNLNEIYADLLEAVYDRKYEKHGYLPLENIELEQFIGILEEIALSCWHGNGRTTTIKEIKSHCDNSGLGQVLKEFQASFEQDSKGCITRLLAAFYFRESGGLRDRDKTFEFTHKSFREYLTAKRIIEEVKNIHEELAARSKNFRKGINETEALVRWAKLCGLSAMDEYLFSFVWDEIELEYAQDPQLIKDWQKMLCHLIEVMLVNGMPMESIEPRPNFQSEMFQSRNAEESLLAVLNACARITREISHIKWHSPTAFGSWIARLQPQREAPKNTLAFSCLSWLNLDNCMLDLRDFYAANFEYSSLVKSDLQVAVLLNANLARANLARANLAGARLARANLVGAHLAGAHLARAHLAGAHLAGAHLEAVDLARADLEGANLEGANLEGANLQRANLNGAILQGANLNGAILKNTILEGQDIAKITGVKNE
ncbi:MAG: pentapeptide repeat-containing protein [Cyanobacteria bacterium J06621_8]